MLPISKHRTLVIPHRLALIAAGVCLALSFTADRSELASKLQADHAEPTEQIDAVSSAPAPIAPPEQAGSSRSRRGGNLSLLPWFSGLSR